MLDAASDGSEALLDVVLVVVLALAVDVEELGLAEIGGLPPRPEPAGGLVGW
jgi:hypothetical protein